MSELLMWRALNDALGTAMREDERVFVMGEDISRWATGGGIFGVTRGLLKEFGPSRVRETPISEEGIVAAAVGAAMAGARPVVEIMYSDFSLLALDPVVNQAAKARYMFGGQFDVPLVLRSNGGAASGKAAQHSQSLETLFAHVPGLEVAIPAFPGDARALLRAAIKSPNPTIFLEHKALYTVRGAVDERPLELGRANVVRAGRDLTIVATQLMVHRALAASEELSCEGIEVELVDLRCLYPLDIETVIDSVRRTRRLLVCHEAPQMFGFGGEIVAQVYDAAYGELDAPIARLGGARTPIPYAPPLEEAVIPSVRAITDAGRALADARVTSVPGYAR
jgi:acetoin:2,6-dichlorophenolindophenol oxidoreductase subunit beta